MSTYAQSSAAAHAEQFVSKPQSGFTGHDAISSTGCGHGMAESLA